MRRKLVHILAAVTAATLVAVVGQVVTAPMSASAAAAEPYTWKNVRIDGGGFVPSIVFNRTAKNVVYARTDIGGAYRWVEATQSWAPMLDWVGQNNWGYNGVISLASDPVETNRVYAALGMYTNSWDPNNGAIGRSTDGGVTWQVSPLPFKNGGNMPGRGMGERLAVDPNRDNIVYFGAEGGYGLWRSTDFGVTWAQVTNFPNVGNYAADPNDVGGYNGTNQGVLWEAFDETTGTRGNATQTIYVGVADKQNSVYRTTNGGTTWERVVGQPTGFLPQKAVLDAPNGLLYLATSDTGGPYDGGDGQVLKYDTRTGAWTDITPDPTGAFGYSGLTIDRQHPGTLMVGTQISWWPDTNFYRTTDGGATWTRAWDWGSYPNRTFRYKMDTTNSPWVDLGSKNPTPPDTSPKLGWMNQGIEIDPFNSDRLFYGTGLTLYGTTDLTKWDVAGGQITIKPMARGLEETAVNDLISPPSGAPLISGLGDVGGFRHANLDVTPATVFTQPGFTTTSSLDYAELNPGVIVRAGDFDKASRPNDSRAAFSTDGGLNWFQGTEPPGVTGGGTIAAAADGSRFVWSPNGATPSYSVGFGNTWTAATGLPTGATVESDRVDKNRFYGFANGTFYLSIDGGATFRAGATGLGNSGHFKAVPGRQGELWFSGSSGVLRSTDSGVTFTRIAAAGASSSIGFGKAAPGQTYPALYLAGIIDGVSGVFRSDNAGAAWVRINDDNHQYGNMGNAISGDPRVFGRVYLGTNGRGVLYADRVGGDPDPAPSAPPLPGTPSPSSPAPGPSSPSTSPSTSPSAPSTPVACQAVYRVTGSWTGGFQAEVTVTNLGRTATTGWRIGWSFPSGQTVASSWGGVHSQTGAVVSVRNADYNGNLAPNASTAFGFIGSAASANDVPSIVSCSTS